MARWAAAPLYRLLLPFMAGIAFAANFENLTRSAFLAIGIISACGFVVLHSYFKYLPYRWRYSPSLLLMICCVSAGALLYQLNEGDKSPVFAGRYNYPAGYMVCRLLAPAVAIPGLYKCEAAVEKIIYQGKEALSQSQIILYIPADSQSATLRYGDILVMAHNAERIPPPMNPDVFDYSAYMAGRHIYLQAFVKQEEWAFSGHRRVNPGWELVYRIRSQLAGEMQRAIGDEESGGVAQALLLGDRSLLDKEIKQAYAGTGTMHVLAVSGLHVGILFLALNFLLRLSNNYDRWRWLKLLLVLLILWAYALLTGFSPSVVRATVMFSFLQVGISLYRLVNVYNSLALAALILLLTDPMLLFQPGFQFSFLALLGIVWLQPKIAALWKVKNKVGNYAWQLATASLAAQLATFPLAMLYFRQFPLWFLPANMLVVPLVFVLFCLGCVFVLISLLHWQPLTFAFGKILGAGIGLLNGLTQWLYSLPVAVVEGLYITPLQCWLLYAGMGLLALALIQRRKGLLWPAMGAFLIFHVLGAWGRYRSYTQPRLDVYALRGAFAMSLQQGDSLFLLADSSFYARPDNMKYIIKPHAEAMYIAPSHIRQISIEDNRDLNFAHCGLKGSLGWYYGQPFVLLRKGDTMPTELSETTPRWLILSGNPTLDIDHLSPDLKIQEVIACGDNSWQRLEKWRIQCRKQGVVFRSLK